MVPLGIHTNVNTYSAVSYWSCFVFFCRRFWRFFTICFLSPSFVVRCLHLQFVCLFVYFVVRALTHPTCLAQDTGLYLCCQFRENFKFRQSSSNFAQISNFYFSHFPAHPAPHDASGFHCHFRFFFALLFFDSSPVSEISRTGL